MFQKKKIFLGGGDLSKIFLAPYRPSFAPQRTHEYTLLCPDSLSHLISHTFRNQNCGWWYVIFSTIIFWGTFLKYLGSMLYRPVCSPKNT